MNLVEERDSWKSSFEKGEKPTIILDDYRKNRNSELWRTTRLVERLCEYILFLEEKNKG